jgi:hypothetical protein
MLLMQTQAAIPGQRTCPDCGAHSHTRFCGECGRALEAPSTESTAGLLREGLSEALGVEKGVFQTLRDLLIRPVRVIQAYWSGEAMEYVRPFKLYFLLAGTYILLLSFVQPMEFKIDDLMQQPNPEQNRVIAELLREKGITQAVLNDRFAQRLNTVLPLVSALLLLPLAALLRRMQPQRPLRDHVLFMASITNATWLACILLLPLSLLGRAPFLVGAQLAGLGYMVWGLARMYPGTTRTRTGLRVAGFILANYLLIIPVVLLMQIAVLASIFLF